MLQLILDGKLNIRGNIMRKTKYNTKELIELFHKKKVLTLNDLKTALGTDVKMTVFRKLKELSYCVSYSHAGSYYTLNETVNYNEHGLWDFGQIHFSKYGSLLNTIETFVRGAESGYFAYELRQILKVRVYMPLLKLFSDRRILREQIVDKYLYLSPETHKIQLDNRKRIIESATLKEIQACSSGYNSPEIIENLTTFLSILNEQQRRLYIGFESMKLGEGGDTIMSKITGMNVKTIANGRKELQYHQIAVDRVRRVGGGRHALKKN